MTNEAEVFDTLVSRVTVDDCGTRRYYNAAGELHREHGPAVEYSTGGRVWYQNGLLHRADGPAIEWPDGTKFWHQCGFLHREDGPAIMRPDGSCEWWINGTEYNERDYNKRLKTRGYA